MEKQSVFESIRLELNWGLVGAAVINWVNNRTPKWLLFVVIAVSGWIGRHGYFLFEEAKQYIEPSVKIVMDGGPEAPVLLASWSMFLMLLAACTQHLYIAFNASLQLYRRFGVKFSA